MAPHEINMRNDGSVEKVEKMNIMIRNLGEAYNVLNLEKINTVTPEEIKALQILTAKIISYKKTLE